MSRGYWSSAISQVLQESAYVNVGLEAELAGNVLTIHVEAYYTASSPQSTNYLHVAMSFAMFSWAIAWTNAKIVNQLDAILLFV